MTNIIEIKAKCLDAMQVRRTLLAHNADFKGTDHQIDTYFNVPTGRLKLRQGTIENTLIHYNRPNQAGPKHSKVTYQRLPANTNIKAVLTAALEVLTVVDKQREIYFIENVKFHIDTVKDLGHFIEIEAIDETGELGLPQLRTQCDHYMELLKVQETALLDVSYSDLILRMTT